MNALKKYAPPLLTLLLVLLGAAMPWLTAQIQDANIRGRQERLELNAVALTLRQDGNVGPVLRLLAEAHAQIFWDGETAMTEQEAHLAAVQTVQELTEAGLLSSESYILLMESPCYLEPSLRIAGDGSSALTWNCSWDCVVPCSIVLDDSTGKAVQFLVSDLPAEHSELVDGCPEPWLAEEDGQAQLKGWSAFLQEYYGAEVLRIEEGSWDMYDTMSRSYRLWFDLGDGEDACGLELSFFEDLAFFNYL